MTRTINKNERTCQENNQVEKVVVFKNELRSKFYIIDYSNFAIDFCEQYGQEPEMSLRYTLYACHFGATMTVSDEQERKFNQAVKRINSKAI